MSLLSKGQHVSALAAVFLREGQPITPTHLGRLSLALAPFGSGRAIEWHDSAAGLVGQPSCIGTPGEPSAGHPIAAGGGSRLCFSGFLHHRPALEQALGFRAYVAAEIPDGALFAHAWERWGDAAASRVHGEFVAVVWEPGRRALHAVCSPLRAPPCYFSIDRRRAVLASTPSTVLAWGDLPRRLNDPLLAGSLILDYGDARDTYFQGVSSLRPGEVLTVTPEADTIRRHYDLATQVKPIRLRAAADYLEAADELLHRAVESALRAPETPALLLSGGLDSTTVAVAALRLLAGRSHALPLRSFTSVPEPGWDARIPGGDESAGVRALARKYPALDARFVDAAGLDADHLQGRTAALAQVPMRNASNLYWAHECRRLARAAGRSVLLSGVSGNATLSYNGLARPAALLRAGRLRELHAALPRGRWGALGPFLRHALLPNLPAPLHRAARRLAFRDPGWRHYSAIHPEFARAMQVEARARARGFDRYFTGGASCLQTRLRMLSGPVRQRDGRSIHLALQAIHGVALRDPLGDRQLVEWCLGLPDEQYYDRGQSRLLIRRLMKDRLPTEVLHAPFGFQAADRHLRLSRGLPLIRETLVAWRKDPAVAGRLDLDRLLRLVDTWPAATPLSRTDHPDHLLASVGLSRALAAGRFIRWAEHGSVAA